MSESTPSDLLSAFRASPGALVSFIGGGGKTTLMEFTARKAARAGYRVLVTTTTRIWPPSSMPFLAMEGEEIDCDKIRDSWQRSLILCIGRGIMGEGKVSGLTPDLACRMSNLFPEAIVLCEADGSAGRPLKVHGDHEPVIPACSTTVAVVAGLDAVGRAASARMIHRFEMFQSLYPHETVISPDTVGRVLVEAGRRAPDTAHVVYVMNKADASQSVSACIRVRDVVLDSCPDATVVLTTWGDVLPRWAGVAVGGPRSGG
jgi:probable selenium-dependent hydroxylase accessory protein YqeC